MDRESDMEAQSCIPKKITLKVVGQGDRTAVFISLKKCTPLGRLMNAYCEHTGKPRDSIVYQFEGNMLQEHHTPADVGLEHLDEITTHTLIAIDGDSAITIRVEGQKDPRELFFLMKRCTPFRRLMNAYCESTGKRRDTFVYLFQGKMLGEEQTHADVGFDHLDEIAAMSHQRGGGGGGNY